MIPSAARRLIDHSLKCGRMHAGTGSETARLVADEHLDGPARNKLLSIARRVGDAADNLTKARAEWEGLLQELMLEREGVKAP